MIAIASGDVQIGYLGSSPLTAAAARTLPVETFLIATQIGAAEALLCPAAHAGAMACASSLISFFCKMHHFGMLH